MGFRPIITDLELTVQRCHEALQPRSGAAFAVTKHGTEQVVIVQEVRRAFLRNLNAEAVLTRIREALIDEHDVQASAIVLNPLT